ncbi:hypothetical protein [Panacagrimonas sp.]|uniref:hypothetical protein n=1 Tax=Panacagrimonas sp. TaxID=2480088 RepID=UPI003B52DF6A
MIAPIRLKGWLDAEHPAAVKNEGLPEFRLTLSEVPSPAWRRAFSEQHQEPHPAVGIEQDIMTLSCELGAIVGAIGKIKQHIRQANESLQRKERETGERIARQAQEREKQRLRILSAVSSIDFED